MLRYGTRALVVTGSKSFTTSAFFESFCKETAKRGITFHQIIIQGEPTIEMVDSVINSYQSQKIQVVIGIGGGSSIDAGKAISAMLTQKKPISCFLEGVGDEQHNGKKIPFIAVPTTAGTGSEATKNAVISKTGRTGFKRSLRHDRFIPDIAIVDPDLTVSCPPDITAYTGLDAMIQLLESFVSVKSNLMSDALAWCGLQEAAKSLIPAVENGDKDLSARSGMSFAALMSGMALANAGLGVIHGFASVIGGYFSIPHGVVCAALFSESSKQIIRSLEKRNPNSEALKKYAETGYLFTGRDGNRISEGCELFLETIDSWIKKTHIPKLKAYGISVTDIDAIVKETGQKNTPVPLTYEQMSLILKKSI